MKTMGTFVIILLLLALCSAIPCDAQTQQNGEKACKMFNHIADNVISDRTPKPMTREIISPSDMSGDLMFSKQSDLTPDFVDRYLSRAVSHFMRMNGLPRANEFFRNTGTKYIHWAFLHWGSQPTDEKFLAMAKEIDDVHSTDWGKDVVFEAGVMEIINRGTTDNTQIPDWLYQSMEELGLTKTRKPGPNGPKYFCYENMFDKSAWPKNYVGIWGKTPDDDWATTVPDITMTETQLWYAYLMAEFIDAGCEGIFFGQIGLTGRRERTKGWECAHALTEFAKRYAASRAYRNAIFLSSHHWQVDYKGKPIYTHLSWPSRMFYNDKFRHGMVCGLDGPENGQHKNQKEFTRLLNAPADLPILIEIDNYGNVGKGHQIAADPEGNDEITAFSLKPAWARAAFLRQYYFQFQLYKNAAGKCRFHLAPSGWREPYIPYDEAGGDEITIKALFKTAK